MIYDELSSALSDIYTFNISIDNVYESVMTNLYFINSGETVDIVQESAFDILDTMAKAINRFIQKVKQFFMKVITYITSYTSELDALTKKAKPILDNWEDKVSITVSGFDYTVMNSPDPDMSEFIKIVSSYNQLISETIKSIKKDDLKRELIDWMSDSNLDKLRGSVLGASSPIEEEDYLDEIRKFYRHNESEKHDIIYTKSDISNIINKSPDLVKEKNRSIKHRDKLVELLTKTENFFNKSCTILYKGNIKTIDSPKLDISDNKFRKESNTYDYSASDYEVVNKLLNLKYKQVNKIASMIQLVASERCIALKDQIKQEKTIIRQFMFGKKDTATESLNFVQDIQVKPSDILLGGGFYVV